jgi:hypothetical protein
MPRLDKPQSGGAAVEYDAAQERGEVVGTLSVASKPKSLARNNKTG